MGTPSSSHPQVPIPQENTLVVVAPPLQLLYLVFLFCSLLVFLFGGRGGVGWSGGDGNKIRKSFVRYFRNTFHASCRKCHANVTHVWTRENMQTICPREEKKASIIRKFNKGKNKKVSQIMELHTCKKDYAPWSMILSICRLKALKLLEQQLYLVHKNL